MGAIALLSVIIGLGLAWWLGGALVAPHPARVGQAPADLGARSVRIAVAGAAPVAGWWRPGRSGKASVLLLHGIRADRRDMLGRARLLARHGHAVLLIDLPAHGESDGQAITLGWRESAAVEAARDWMRRQRPHEKTAAIGVSLGGAAILLGRQPAGFDAVVLEAVYSDVHDALRNRLGMRGGAPARAFAPLLEMQLAPRLGVSAQQLRPIAHIGQLGAPVLLIAGGRDRHTRPDEAWAMYRQAHQPKQLWLLPEAAHQDFLACAPEQYERRVIGFLQRHLDNQAGSKQGRRHQ